MDEKTLFEQGFKRWEMLLAAWNFYLVVVFALIVLFVLSKSARTDRRVFWIMVSGFGFFAWTHLLGLLYILKQWTAIAAELKTKVAVRIPNDVLESRFANAGIIDAPEAVWVVPFHIIVDVFVVAAIWWLCRERAGTVQSV